MQFEQKTLSKIQWNPFDMIGKQWYLLTAGGLSDYNTMTASWGFMGEMWGKPSFLCGVRTNRHTLPFMEQNDCFSVSFFEESQRAALQFCGTHSGRDYDKAKETGWCCNVCRSKAGSDLQETVYRYAEAGGIFDSGNLPEMV